MRGLGKDIIPGETVERLLDSAERHFAEHGFKGASLRLITADAGANVASVNYHFGSKNHLIKAVLMRRAVPVNEERIRLLNAAQVKAQGGNLTLLEIFEAFLRPLVTVMQTKEGPNYPLMRLAVRIEQEEGEIWLEIFKESFAPMVELYMDAIHKAVPNMPEDELQWRFHFVISSMIGALMRQHGTCQCMGDTSDHENVDRMITRLRDFVTAGFGAGFESV